MMNIVNELEGLYVERGELEAEIKKLDEERGYNNMSQSERSLALNELDYTDEYIVAQDGLYIVNLAISELEFKLELDRLGMTEEEYFEAPREERTDKYYSSNRCELLAERFFKIIEEGGEYAELFLIRDLMISEYIEYGGCGVIELLQIDDIIEELVNETALEEVNVDLNDENVIEAYKCMWAGELERAFELVNEYGDYVNSHPYIYYSLVRELERITGETYVELCI